MKERYIELLKRSLVDFHNIHFTQTYPIGNLGQTWKTKLLKPFDAILRRRNFGIFKLIKPSKEKRQVGADWPSQAKTMIGLERLNNVEFCVSSILEDKVEGDFVETGVWRGGVLIFVKALLEINEINNRKVWGFDSFEGLPKPNATDYPLDSGNKLNQIKLLSCSKKEVLNNFDLYGVDISNVILEEGWFKDTLPKNRVEKISILRLDGDLFESTWLALEYLYPKVSENGYIIVDDYNAFDYCKKAVDLYLETNQIQADIIQIDTESIFWKKKSNEN